MQAVHCSKNRQKGEKSGVCQHVTFVAIKDCHHVKAAKSISRVIIASVISKPK